MKNKTGVKCPHCGHQTSTVQDTRAYGDDLRRRRKCQKCEDTFTTIEMDFDEFTRVRRMGSTKAEQRVRDALITLEQALK